MEIKRIRDIEKAYELTQDEEAYDKAMAEHKIAIRDFLIEYCTDEEGIIDLTCLDFRKRATSVDTSYMKVSGNLAQDFQRVEGNLIQCFQKVSGNLIQCNQEVEGNLDQSCQIAELNIIQNNQKAGNDIYTELLLAKGKVHRGLEPEEYVEWERLLESADFLKQIKIEE